MMVRDVLGKIERIKLKRKWRKMNSHNSTEYVGNWNQSLVHVGNYSYGGINVLTFNDNSKLIIGSYCSVAPNVMFMLSADHYTSHISTFPFKVKMMGESFEGHSKGDIIVDDDVWIGYGAVIMSGVHIEQGAVIAAGAVVTKDVPPYSIVGGVPAKVIKYRFDEKIIQGLLKVDYSKLHREMITEHIDELYSDLSDLNQIDWMFKE